MRIAMSYLRVPAERGSFVAQYVMGMLTHIVYFNTGTKADFLQSATWLYRGARQNHAESQYQLGEMLRHDLFREHDRNDYLARKYIKLAANQLHVMASVRMREFNCCLMCGEDAAPRMCKLCRQARYCNYECSTRHWLEGGGVGGPKSGRPDFKHKHTCTRNAY
jgi:TPR repeat protein